MAKNKKKLLGLFLILFVPIITFIAIILGIQQYMFFLPLA